MFRVSAANVRRRKVYHNTESPACHYHRNNDTHTSMTDPEARLLTKSKGDKSRLCYLGHALMENRNGLVVDVETTQSTGTAERDAATTMVERSLKSGATLGAVPVLVSKPCRLIPR